MKIFKITNKILLYMIFISIFFMLAGLTYSYFVAALEGSETNTTITAEAGYMNIVYNSGPSINSEGLAPATEAFATKVFTVTGTSNIAYSEIGYKITLIVDENTLTEGAISYTLIGSNEAGNGTLVSNTTERQGIGATNVLLGTGKFKGKITNGIHRYELKLYFYETMEDQTVDMNKTFRAHIGIENYDPCVGGICLKDKILSQGGGPATIEAKGNPNFAQIATTADSGLYASPDEYGISYYYRGIRENLNNNLIFGGFQWKIVRINGDDSIRIIYNGTEAHFNQSGTMNTTDTNTQIGLYSWNTTNYNDAKYVGYMYGGNNGLASTIRSGIISTAATFNETNSNIKTQVESWYQTNIVGKPSESKITDNLFCNDRQLQSEVGGVATGPGYGNTGTTTYYASFYRLIMEKKPTLKCGLKNDRFTKNDILLGNGALTYPVGLITADEAAMAGIVNGIFSPDNFLYINEDAWTFSPSCMDKDGYALVLIMSSNGWSSGTVSFSRSLRPTLNLKANVTVTGEGSATNPYRVID